MNLLNRSFAAAALSVAFPLAACAADPQPAKSAADKPAAAAPAAEKSAPVAPRKDDKPMSDPLHPVVLMKTSLGDIKIKLDKEKAPVTVDNFLKYAAEKHYDGTIFHRVISSFMIQGGGFGPDMVQKKTMAPIKLESQNGLTNKRGTIAMARTSVPDSATSQFFINVVDNGMLNYRPGPGGEGYTVFGEVIDGMDTVDKIKAVPTGAKGGHQDVPTTNVTIESIRLVP